MKVVIIGAGGVGGYFGARWADCGLDVTLVARGAHGEQIKANGVQLLSPFGDARVQIKCVSDIQQAGSADVVIVAIKSWQLDDVLEPLKAIVGPSTVVFGLQNGVEAAGILANAIGVEHVLGGTCRIISYIEQPGVIRHVGVEPVIIIGELKPGQTDRAEQLGRLLNQDKTHQVIVTDDIQLELWKKLLFFAPVSGLGSVTRAPIGAICSEPQTRELLNKAMHEVCDLGSKMGIALNPGMVDATLKITESLPFGGTTSMQRDFQDGRRTELEALAGVVVRLGQQYDVPTPVHDFIYASLLPLERKFRGDLEWPD